MAATAVGSVVANVGVAAPPPRASVGASVGASASSAAPPAAVRGSIEATLLLALRCLRLGGLSRHVARRGRLGGCDRGRGCAAATRGRSDVVLVALFVLGAEQPGKQALRLRRRRIGAVAAGLDLGAGFLVARHRLAVRGDMHRLAVREQARQLVVIHARPGAHRADVEMDEIGGLIIADPAALHAHADLAQLFDRDAWHRRIHRLAEHVLRSFRHLARAPAQHRVRLGRAIAGIDDDRLIDDAGGMIDLPDHVEEARVHVGRPRRGANRAGTNSACRAWPGRTARSAGTWRRSLPWCSDGRG